MGLFSTQQSFRIRAIGIRIFAYMKFTRDFTLLLFTHRVMATDFIHTQHTITDHSCYFFIPRYCSVVQGELCMFGAKFPASGFSYKGK